MKLKQKLDKVLDLVKEKVEDEVGSLLGESFTLSESAKKIISKEDFFDEQNGKLVIARFDVVGEIQGLGALVVGLKDAIRLGGTLIMLPSAELDEVSSSENYTEELEDSYGEIANIIAGSYTKAFEDSFPKDCRFVRKEQEVVVPTKVDIDSEEPFPEQSYYWICSQITLDGQDLGDMSVIIPATAFGLEETAQDASEVGETSAATQQESATASSQEETAPVNEPEKVSVTADESKKESAPVDAATTSQDAAEKPEHLTGKALEKHKKLIDKLLAACQGTVVSEVEALLGVSVKLGDAENRIISKEDFFQEELSGKQVCAEMDIVGDVEGKSYLFVTLKDAIRIGSTLIMLPPAELEAAVSEEEFTEDAKDAYGEIANIISGAYTTTFQDQYTKSLRFIKKNVDVVAPLKVDCETDEVAINQLYYLTRNIIEIDGTVYGDFSLLLPAGIMELEGLAGDTVADGVVENEESSAVEKQPAPASASEENVDSSGSVSEDGKQVEIDHSAEILIIENDAAEAGKMQEAMGNANISAKRISFSDSVNPHLTDGIKLIFIVMHDVDEQAYGIAIKLRAMRNVPIIAAGSEWTRSRVIKAVKYGVSDILLTPASTEDIQEKLNNNMVELAA